MVSRCRGTKHCFSYDVDYVLGNAMFSYSLEVAFKHSIHEGLSRPTRETEMQPRLTLSLMTADGNDSYVHMTTHLGHKKGFGVITAVGC